MYKKILVPLDGSKMAEIVLPHVETVAKSCELPVIELVRVIQEAQPTVGDYVLKPAQVSEINVENRKAAEQYLGEIAKTLNITGVQVHTKVLMGKEAETIADHAKKEGYDLIVIATHGRSGVSRWVWGSVADKILRSACVPVLMVRAPGCVPGF